MQSQKALQQVATALLQLSTVEEMTAFLRDITTVAEITSMGERLAVAGMVSEGKTYREIAETLSVSTTTVTRVAHWYHHGEGGYKTVLERLH